MGLEKNGRKGDQLVQVDVKVPEELSSNEEKLLQEFAEKAGLKY